MLKKIFITGGIALAAYVLNSMRLMGLVEIGLFEVVPINQRLMGYCRIKNFELIKKQHRLYYR